MPTRNRRKLDLDVLRGTGQALSKAFKVSPSSSPPHVAADAAAAEFEALLAKLNNPPPQYQGKQA